ncbi:MBL fold metallo-hydrolase [Pseudonocardia nigra]|uniref:MBL fold metallo-hydrolase n=1 Tax=Pseudonocardia nigra TaxID=1921578 RepID=UPI0035561481
MLGTAGGPRPSPDRAAPAQALVIEGHVYVVDCGSGVARQMVLAGLQLRDVEAVFITHHHIDHTADLGNLPLLAWTAGRKRPMRLVGASANGSHLRRLPEHGGGRARRAYLDHRSGPVPRPGGRRRGVRARSGL